MRGINMMNAGNLNQISAIPPLNPEAFNTEHVFAIEGNIGCGKSTLLELLRSRIPEARWIQEPVADWQNLGGKNINLLERYYKGPTRWGFTFQVYAIFTRIEKLHEAMQRFPDKIKISERSILADKYVFSEIMRDEGFMDASEYQIFKSIYNNFETIASPEKTKLIYLRCQPAKCYERTKLRQRPEENEIPLAYLEKIHYKHEKWFNHLPQGQALVIDSNEDFRSNEDKIQNIIARIKGFMKSG